jgi:hypothetical protein
MEMAQLAAVAEVSTSGMVVFLLVYLNLFFFLAIVSK